MLASIWIHQCHPCVRSCLRTLLSWLFVLVSALILVLGRMAWVIRLVIESTAVMCDVLFGLDALCFLVTPCQIHCWTELKTMADACMHPSKQPGISLLCFMHNISHEDQHHPSAHQDLLEYVEMCQGSTGKKPSNCIHHTTLQTLSPQQILPYSNLPPADHNTASCHCLTKEIYQSQC